MMIAPVLDVYKARIDELPVGWRVSGDYAPGNYGAACEAERAVRAAAPEGILLIDWYPISRVGRQIVRAVIGGAS